MKTNLFRVFNLTTVIIFLSASLVFGQISTSSSGARGFEPDNAGENKINQVTTDAGIHFKQGLLLLNDGRRPMAREEFDKAVEAFLMSNINVTTNAKLNNCYNQMLETIYRIEFPSQQLPQIQSLTLTCGWNIDNQLAGNVIKLTQAPATNTNASNDQNLIKPEAVGAQTEFKQIGFSEQIFESNGDELAMLPPELNQEEIAAVNTPEAREIYEKIDFAIKNKSFGFFFHMNPMVQQYIYYYQGRGRVTMEQGLARSGMFNRMARHIFREEGLPENIIWLGQVESAWKPVAKSQVGAAGLWQFMPGTGARYGLRVNGYMDERNSFEKATRASAQYLKFLANRYNGNWELAMAAYNCGEGNVDRAIRRAGANDFWAAYPYLPRETRNYVPNILAVILIANNPNYYGFGHIRPLPQLQYELIRVNPSTNLSTIAQLSDTTVDYIRWLNPEFRSTVTPPEPYTIRVPAGKGNNVAAVLRRSSGGANNLVATTVMQTPTSTKALQIITVSSGDTVAKIAAKFGMTKAELAQLNGLPSIDSPLKAGQQIRVQAK